MKTDGQINHKIKQTIFRHRKKRVRDATKKSPCNCKFNSTLPFPETFISELEDVQVCTYPDNLVVCDENVEGGLEQAQNCDFFHCKANIERIKENFQKELSEMSLAEIAAHYPDTAALMWAADYEKFDLDLGEEEDEG